ncbi:hypothetical protein [Hymenobacter cellulosilyticus]|uniref:Peptidylprolyl isomerase n=1 Tax=Hymenobacter cellulosilyticus TaxID=2932248 RepID=A0A8T9Q5Z7_9BACT|nr:hypothetical protein [Hymenobacter cellulosilyticus]UOQ72392.1 hypothetical protein MUN79_28290 [Hymenobacter cellulosilyticus]
MASDTTLTLTITGHPKRGEAANLVGPRVAGVKSYLVGKGAVARRITTSTSKAATADGAAILALTSASPTALEESLNEQNPLAVQIQQRSFQKGDNKVVDELLSKGPGTYTVNKDGRYYAVTIDKVLPAGPKTLAEARGQATSDYQNFLEKQWISQLRDQYPVKVNQPEVDKLVTK